MKSLALIDRATYIDISDYNMIVNGWIDWSRTHTRYAMEESSVLRVFVSFLSWIRLSEQEISCLKYRKIPRWS